MVHIKLQRDIQGSILDIGGGGEGIVGRLYGDRVIAIDNQQEELDEAPDCCEKRLMDATSLVFPNGTFDNVTFFYALMYMGREAQEKALAEAARVLKSGGQLYIWDTEFETAWPEPFVVELDIRWEDGALSTAYGIGKAEGQDRVLFLQMAEKLGLLLETSAGREGQFFLRFRKE